MRTVKPVLFRQQARLLSPGYGVISVRISVDTGAGVGWMGDFQGASRSGSSDKGKKSCQTRVNRVDFPPREAGLPVRESLKGMTFFSLRPAFRFHCGTGQIHTSSPKQQNVVFFQMLSAVCNPAGGPGGTGIPVHLQSVVNTFLVAGFCGCAG